MRAYVRVSMCVRVCSACMRAYAVVFSEWLSGE